MMSSNQDDRPEAADEFEDAFAQASAQRGPTTTSAPADEDDDAGAAGQPDDQGADDTAQTDEAPAAAAASPSSAAAAPPGPAAPEARLSELDAKLAAALHRERSVAGRIAASDRRLAEVERENAALKQQIATAKASPKAPAAGAAGQGADDDVLNRTPELQTAIARRIDAAAAPLREALDAANAKLAEVGQASAAANERLSPVAEQHEREAITRTLGEVDQMFTPRWRQDCRSSEFAEWIGGQPQPIQQLYASAKTTADTVAVLDAFYAPRGGRPRPTQTTQPNTPSTPATRRAADPVDRLRESAGVPARAAQRAAPPSPEDFEGAFAEAAAARRRR